MEARARTEDIVGKVVKMWVMISLGKLSRSMVGGVTSLTARLLVLVLRGGALSSFFFYDLRRVVSLGTVQLPLLRGEVLSSGGEEGDQAASTPSLGLYEMTDKAAWKRQGIVARPERPRVLSSRMVVGEGGRGSRVTNVR